MTEPTTLRSLDGAVLLGPVAGVRLSDGRLAVRTSAEPPAVTLTEVVVDGVPGTAEVVRSGRWHAEACDRLDQAADQADGWVRRRARRLLPRRTRDRDAPVVLVRLRPGAVSE